MVFRPAKCDGGLWRANELAKCDQKAIGFLPGYRLPRRESKAWRE